MRSSTSNYNLFYDGNQNNKRFVLSIDEAEKWWYSFQPDELYKYEFRHSHRKSVNVIPLIVEEGGEVLNEKFAGYMIKEERISSQIKNLIVEFMKKFDIVRDSR